MAVVSVPPAFHAFASPAAAVLTIVIGLVVLVLIGVLFMIIEVKLEKSE